MPHPPFGDLGPPPPWQSTLGVVTVEPVGCLGSLRSGAMSVGGLLAKPALGEHWEAGEQGCGRVFALCTQLPAPSPPCGGAPSSCSTRFVNSDPRAPLVGLRANTGAWFETETSSSHFSLCEAEPSGSEGLRPTHDIYIWSLSIGMV